MKFLIVATLVAIVTAKTLPVLTYGASADLIPNEYIVAFSHNNLGKSSFTSFQARHPNVQVKGSYKIGNLLAVGIKADDSDLEQLRHEDGIEMIQQNMQTRLFGVQRNPTWGLDRSDQRELPLDDLYYYDDDTQGNGVNVIVMDTGVSLTHNDWQGNAVFGANFASDAPAPGDCHGHGTHVAGSIGAKTYGLAKKTTIWSVKVLECSGMGNLFGILGGYEWAVEFHQRNATGVTVINMSLGAMYNVILDWATTEVVQAGVAIIAAAGNDDNDACTFSPASNELAITVAASTKDDEKAVFSNHGKCVDFFAPGHQITSLDNEDDNGVKTYSGTSMACPHGAGGAALVLSGRDPPRSPAALRDAMVAQATKDVIKGDLPAGTPNLLMFTNPQRN